MKSGQNIRASILDRLIDLEPRASHEPFQKRMFDIRQIKALVVRDLENLLNTRRQIIPVPVSYKEVNNSVFTYGLGDFTAENTKSPALRRQLRQDIENTILRFEPRLKNVSVRLEEDMEAGKNLRFRISGILVVESEAEPVSFDTYFDTNKGEYVIQK